jgi:hypothetical protein
MTDIFPLLVYELILRTVQFRMNSEFDIDGWSSDLMYDQANKSYGFIMEGVQYSIRYSDYGMKQTIVSSWLYYQIGNNKKSTGF